MPASNRTSFKPDLSSPWIQPCAPTSGPSHRANLAHGGLPFLQEMLALAEQEPETPPPEMQEVIPSGTHPAQAFAEYVAAYDAWYYSPARRPSAPPAVRAVRRARRFENHLRTLRMEPLDRP
jgi:hypothetical protein